MSTTETHKCGECGDTFDTARGCSIHQTLQHNQSGWSDANTLQELHHERELDVPEMAEELDVTRHTIVNQMRKHEIDIRDAWECGVCDSVFDTRKGLSAHETTQHNEKKWEDSDWLRDQYIDKRKGAVRIAREQGTTEHTITSYLEKHGIEQRSFSESLKNYHRHAPAPFFTGTHGYEFWRTGYEGEQYTVKHHRLLAVAEHGYDAVVGKSIHHKNGIEWDNRPSNIEILSRSEHTKRHYDEMVYSREVYTTAEECQAYREDSPELSYSEIGEKYDVPKHIVSYHVAGKCAHD